MLPEDAKNNIGGYVIAIDPHYGKYIGILEDVFCPTSWRAKVRIVFCLSNPSDIKPFDCATVENFDLEAIELCCYNSL